MGVPKLVLTWLTLQLMYFFIIEFSPCGRHGGCIMDMLSSHWSCCQLIQFDESLVHNAPLLPAAAAFCFACPSE
jgi:hypothetical protein